MHNIILKTKWKKYSKIYRTHIRDRLVLGVICSEQFPFSIISISC